MKKLLLVLLTLAALLTVVSCGPKTDDLADITVTNTQLGLKFAYPEGWSVVQNDSLVQICQASGKVTNLTAFVMTLPQGTTLEQYLAQGYPASLTQDLKQLTMETKDLKKTTDTLTWTCFIYTAQYLTDTENAATYRFMQAFAQKEERVAVMTLCAPAQEFSQFNKLFEASLSTFEFTQPQPPQALPQSQTVTNDAVEYVLPCPQGWQVVRNDGMIALQAPDRSTLSSAAFSANKVKSLDVFMTDHYLAELKATLGNYQLLGQYQALTVLDRYPALDCQYTATANGTTYQFYHRLISRDGYIYSFLYTATQGNFAANQEAVNALLAGIRFK